MGARRKKIPIDKIVLVGGFGDSPALQDYLADSINLINEKHRTDIQIIFTHTNRGAAGVARGAVMRAQNKKNGPKRIVRQSIGVYEHLCCDDDESYPKAVLDQVSELNKVERCHYVMDTIVWKIKTVSQ